MFERNIVSSIRGPFLDKIIEIRIENLNPTESEKAMEELIRKITQALVDRPEKVSIENIEGERTTILELRVAKEDLGKVIGKEGRTVQSLRTILKAVSGKHDKRTILQVIE